MVDIRLWARRAGRHIRYVTHTPEPAAGRHALGPGRRRRWWLGRLRDRGTLEHRPRPIGRAGRNISRGAAVDHIFGYTVANDVTARDLQFLDGKQWYRGKSLDTFGPLGPCIVTADELADARGLRLTLRVNGITKQDASTDELLFPVPEIVASASAGRTLLPGDVILTGTPAGVGFTRTPPEYLRDGDVVEAEIDRIGVLRNQIRVIQ